MTLLRVCAECVDQPQDLKLSIIGHFKVTSRGYDSARHSGGMRTRSYILGNDIDVPWRGVLVV